MGYSRTREIQLNFCKVSSQYSLCLRYYKNADGILLVYDITDKGIVLILNATDSFTKVKDWISNIHEHANRDIPVMLIGNKLDLEKYKKKSKFSELIFNVFQISQTINYCFKITTIFSERVVETNEGKKIAEDNEIDFEEVSALDATNIEPTFMKIIRKVVDIKDSAQVKLHLRS